MALDLSTFAADLAEIAGDVAQTVTIGGDEFTAIVSGQVSAKNWQMVGYLPENGIEVHLLTSESPTVSPGTLLTHNGTVYRVISKETDPFGAAIRLLCEERQK